MRSSLLHKLGLVLGLGGLSLACAESEDVVARLVPGGPDAGSGEGASGAGGSGGFEVDAGATTDAGPQCPSCSPDYRSVIGCDGQVKETCGEGELCGAGTCMAACDAAVANQSSVGCDYYAVAMSTMGGGFGGCFVTFVANTSDLPVKIQASFGTLPIDLSAHAFVPKGSGPSLSYEPVDLATGLPPGEVAILFLANDPVPHGTWQAPAACPKPAAIGLDAHVHYGLNISTGRGKAFHITTDQPVVAYQMLPYNAAFAATTGATLLLPTSAWGTNYIGVQAYSSAYGQGLSIPPSMSLVAMHDATTVKLVPTAEIHAGLNVKGTPLGQLGTYTLSQGEVIEFIQSAELTGTPIESDKPIAVFAGHTGLRVPTHTDYSDHAEQQIPPVNALGSEYAVASYRDRVPGFAENRRHRLIGAVDGTVLTFDPPIPGAPTTLELGTIAEITTDTPFVVKSQDADHPFLAFTYMSSSGNIASAGGPAGYGDPEFVRIVPGAQYLNRYVFFTDPTYPETNLVVVRRKGDGGYADVTLDCLGVLNGWQPIGDGTTYELTRVDLSRHNFEPQGNCNNGRREMSSEQPFGLWVWGWGSPETRPGEMFPCDNSQPNNSCDVSYGYPAGENVRPINEVVVVPIPH